MIGLVALADYWMTPDDLEGYETGRRDYPTYQILILKLIIDNL